MPTRRLTRDERIARFWTMVVVGTADECWRWTGAGRLYGRFTFEGRMTQTTHVSWMLTNGPIPEGMQVLHRCDNPPCVNPGHLFLGTQADNLRDCHVKGRRNYAKNERHGMSKLTPADVALIRASTEPSRVLALRLGVCAMTVTNVRSGRTWKAA